VTYEHAQGTRRALEGIAGVVCPPEARELGLIADVVDHVALTMGVLPPLFRNGLVMGLRSYDLLAIARYGKPAHRLAPERAEGYFLWWLHGVTPLQRQFATGAKQLCTLAYYELPAVQERLGYRPTQWIEKVKRRRLDVYADDIQAHQRSLIAPDPLPGVRRHARKERA
jgi:hypothetical protein